VRGLVHRRACCAPHGVVSDTGGGYGESQRILSAGSGARVTVSHLAGRQTSPSFGQRSATSSITSQTDRPVRGQQVLPLLIATIAAAPSSGDTKGLQAGREKKNAIRSA